jgi:hypothetical protein
LVIRCVSHIGECHGEVRSDIVQYSEKLAAEGAAWSEDQAVEEALTF